MSRIRTCNRGPSVIGRAQSGRQCLIPEIISTLFQLVAMARLGNLVRVRHMRDIDCEVVRSSFQAMRLGKMMIPSAAPRLSLHGAIPVGD